MSQMETPKPKLELEQIAELNFERWADALKNKSLEGVVALYDSEDLIFHPTLSPTLITTIEGTREYFEKFLRKNPICEIKQEIVKPRGDKFYEHAGLYNFNVTAGDGTQSMVEARFNFTWKKGDNNEWKIVSHHSSLAPEKSK